jgi:multiple sugar transport system permease protein
MFSSLWSDAGDIQVWTSLRNTVYYTAFHVPLAMLLAFFVAQLLNADVWAMPLFRTMFYLPSITTSVASVIVWSFLFQPDGLINKALGLFGIPGPYWLTSTTWAMPALIIMAVWKNLGFNMVIFLAGLQGIPAQLYEAASIDGANGWHRFRYITVPMLAPTTFFVLVISVIGSFQVFDLAFVLTKGGPGEATNTMVMYIYNQAFQFFHMGYAAAIAWVLFAIIFLITLAQTQLQKRWVHYENE